MWSTIASLKDNFAAIANDVLDTADELENDEEVKSPKDFGNHHKARGVADGAADLELHEDVDLNERSKADIEGELRWYKAEVERLSANDSDIQALSTNYSNLLRERELDIQRLQAENKELEAELQITQRERVSQEESKKLQERIKSLSEELQKAADANQDQLAALQDHHRQQTSALLLKHRKQLEEVRAEVSSSANGHDSNGYVTSENLQSKLQEASHRAHEAESSLQQAREQEKFHLKQLAEKVEACRQLQASLERKESDLTKLKDVLASQDATRNEMQQQLKKKEDEVVEARNEANQLEADHDQLSRDLQKWRAEKEEATTAAQTLREQLQEALSQRESLSSQLNALKGELDASRSAGLREAEELWGRMTEVEQQAAAMRAAEDQAHARETAGIREEYERRLAEMQRTISEQEGLLQALRRQQEEGGEWSTEAAAKEEELGRMRQEVDGLRDRLRSSEEATSRQAEEHQKQLEQMLEEKDKAKRDLARLKQHLLEKAEEESEKMSEDSTRIADLEARCLDLEARRKSLEELLATTREELERERASSTQGVQATAEEVDRLRGELDEALASLSSKDMELVNLNSALGQYYAETEAKERLQGELHQAREELDKLAAELEASQKAISAKEAEKQSAAEQAAAAEARVAAAERGKSKLQEEVDRLRKALEQSMTRIHRMSSDSDQYVDRRIVIKLLITYFEKRHSAEALDLMARILGFTEEDKKRVGLARVGLERRGSMVSGVLGAPGRIVGAVFGGASAPSSPRASVSDRDLSSATFTDLWIDFLLKEAQQQEEQRRIDERAAEERKALAAMSEEQFTLPRARPSLSPQSSVSAANLPGVYNPNTYSNTASSPTGGALPGVFYANALSPKPVANSDRRKSGIPEPDALVLPSPRAIGQHSNSGDFSSVSLNTNIGEK